MKHIISIITVLILASLLLLIKEIFRNVKCLNAILTSFRINSFKLARQIVCSPQMLLNSETVGLKNINYRNLPPKEIKS